MRGLRMVLAAAVVLAWGRGVMGAEATFVPIGLGWAGSSVNTVVFRHGPLATFGEVQYAAFYDEAGKVVVAKRELGSSKWDVKVTQYSGNATDAHNTIVIAVDGAGILHMSWDHHGNKLNYVRSVAAGSLELTEKLETDGVREEQVTYPEFYNLPNGDLLLQYRVGRSGNGDVVLKRYSVGEGKWSTVQANLISGEGKENAYTETAVDAKGGIHVGWVWRRTPDVKTNHNVCYARSLDGGKTWENSKGEKLALPIVSGTAEVAVRIGEGSDLINQTSMAADDAGHPYIGTYFKTDGVAQYRVVFNDGSGWKVSQVGERKGDLNLGGMGTQRIPISRPLVLVGKGERPAVRVVFRDAERGERVSVATNVDIGGGGKWVIEDVTEEGWGAWEPTYDVGLWKGKGELDLFVQKVGQVSGGDNVKGGEKVPGTMTGVLELKGW